MTRLDKQGPRAPRPRLALKRTWMRPSKRARQRLEQERAELVEARAAIIVRSKGRCEAQCSIECTRVGTQAHHKLPRSAGGPHTAENLLWVDDKCHAAIHAYPNMARARGLLKSRYEGDA